MKKVSQQQKLLKALKRASNILSMFDVDADQYHAPCEWFDIFKEQYQIEMLIARTRGDKEKQKKLKERYKYITGK